MESNHGNQILHPAAWVGGAEGSRELVTHVEVLQAVDGVLSIQQLVGQVHNLLLHRLLVSLHLP